MPVLPRASPVHYECLTIFLQECPLAEADALARLWTTGCFRNPWPKTPLLHLAVPPVADEEAWLRITDICGLGMMRSLPQEIVELIRPLTPHALFWRAFSTVSLASSTTTVPQPLLVLPLCDIESWTRGGPVVRVSEQGRLPCLRLTIDANGIQSIERIQDLPQYSYMETTANLHAYLVAPETQLAGVQAHLKVTCTTPAKPACLFPI